MAVAHRIDIEPLIRQRRCLVPGIPLFTTWLDVLLARAFNDQAGYHVLRGVMGCKFQDYGNLARRIVEEEKEHGAEGAQLLIQYSLGRRADLDRMRAAVAVHLGAAIRCVGRADTEGDREAVRLGLKTRSSAETLAEFSDYADQVLAAAGLTWFSPLRSNIDTLTQDHWNRGTKVT